MGFFSDLKEDLSQAVNELMPEEELKKTALQEAESAQEAEEDREEAIAGDGSGQSEAADALKGLDMDMSDLDALLERVDTIEVPEDMDITRLDKTEEETAVDEAPAARGPEKETEEGQFDDGAAEAEPCEQEGAAEENDLEASIRAAFGEKEDTDKGVERMDIQMRSAADETAVITAGMTITGDIASEGSMDVVGTINGNVNILGKLNITGTITGNSKAAEIFADSAKITGEIVSDGAVKIGQSSVIIGNIAAKSAVVAGAVKGDIDVQGPVVLDASAIVMGNIKSKSVQINNGAVIEGMCSQCYADVNPTSFFEDYKKNKK